MQKIIKPIAFLLAAAVLFYVGKPKLAAFYNNKGLAYYENGQYRESLDFFEKSLRLDPFKAVTHYNLANAYMGLGARETEAAEEYEKAIRLDPALSEAYRALANIYLGRQMYTRAIDLITQAQTGVPDKKNDSLRNRVDFEYAVDCLSKSVDSFLSGDKERAHALLKTALKIKPDFAYIHYTQGYFYYVDGNYDEAEASLNEAVLHDTRFYLAYKVLGDIALKKGDYEKAVDKYKAAISLNNKVPVLYNDLGLIFMRMERYGEAVEYMEQAAMLDPENIDIRYSLASVYRDNGQFDEAVSKYNETLGLRPDYPGAHNDLGDIYKTQGKDNEALAEYAMEIRYSKEKLAKNENDLIILSNLAYAYRNSGETALAEETINRAIALDPGYQAAYLTLARIQEDSRDHKSALRSLKKARELSVASQPNFIDRDISRLKASINLLNIYPDEVYLKNGRLIKGLIKKQTQENVVLDVNIGKSAGEITLPRDSIERVVRSSDPQTD
ncbi:MAG: tetratricopeptide repeat protein [Candidatus Omnitrophica bacterium]|nr:tetratricopeptide repeat protein [Candidatus Omnitrophota bacterium]